MVRFNIFKVSTRRFIAFISAGLLFGFAIWFVNHQLPIKGVWDKYYTEKEIGTFFCEKTNMDNLVRQPINTFSNFIYLLAAMVIIRTGLKDLGTEKRYNMVSANPFYSFTFGFIMLYIFCASVFFHSSLIHFASELDFSAVYTLSLFPLMYFTHRVWLLEIGVPSNKRHPKSTWTVITVFSLAYLGLLLFVPPGTADYFVLGIIVLIAAFGGFVEARAPGRTNHYYLLTSIVCIAFAVLCFACDVKKWICHPGSYIQPHSLWHLFSGISAFYFYMYIRSEKNKI